MKKIPLAVASEELVSTKSENVGAEMRYLPQYKPRLARLRFKFQIPYPRLYLPLRDPNDISLVDLFLNTVRRHEFLSLHSRC